MWGDELKMEAKASEGREMDPLHSWRSGGKRPERGTVAQMGGKRTRRKLKPNHTITRKMTDSMRSTSQIKSSVWL